MKKILLFVVLITFFSFDVNAEFDVNDDFVFSPGFEIDESVSVMCRIIDYLHNIGGPIITLVVIGASLLSIFGKMPWPALFALGIFTAVFFGAQAIMISVVPTSDTYTCQDNLNLLPAVPQSSQFFGRMLSSLWPFW